jgi:deoxycytidylate deaminase
MYILGFPCVDCAKQIARSGIGRVVIESPKQSDAESMLAQSDFHEAKFMFAAKGIELCVDGQEIILSLPYEYYMTGSDI